MEGDGIKHSRKHMFDSGVEKDKAIHNNGEHVLQDHRSICLLSFFLIPSNPLPSSRHHPSYDGSLEDNCSVLYCVLQLCT